MEGINHQIPEGAGPQRRYWKFVLGFFAVIIGVFILYVIGFWGVRYYEKWQAGRTLDKLVEAMKQGEEEDYRRAMADTFGGKTPQETLQMYIEAVEKGDYELASKYFIGDYQERELKSLHNSPRENTENILKLLKQSLSSSSSFSWDKKGFLIEKPILVDFKLYPNGIWKIIEI